MPPKNYDPKEYEDRDSDVKNWDAERDAEATRVSRIISDSSVSDEDAEQARREYLDKYYPS